jgi:uncharacterized FlgJ-related protein
MTTQIIIDFNEVLISLALNIAEVCPNSVIGAHINDIQKIIRRKENFNKFIDMFCLKVLQYKDRIEACDESYFLEKDFKNDLDGEEVSALDHIISLKSVWKDLKQENKQIVMMSMQVLCELAQQYFDIKFA